MKTKTSILALTKAFFILLVMCCLFSCHNHMNEYTIVKSVKANSIGKEKYRVELEFQLANQYLYTDSVFAVGDTLWLHK
jgi:hypothetical protein